MPALESRHSAGPASAAPAGLPTSVDVLVVGLGPVGATIACLLGRLGIRTLVVDKATEILMHPRAIGLDNEAQRILQSAGLPEGSFATMAITEARLISPWFGEFARFPTSGVIDGYPRLITFYQPDLERALRKQAATHSCVTTVGGIELVGFVDDDKEVTATLASGDGSQTQVRARYLIGADGASSIVRQLIGQDFTGQSYPEEWLIVDAVQSPRNLQVIEFHCRPDGARPHVPAPGNRERWEFMLRPGQTAEQMLADEEIRKLLAAWGDPDSMQIERRAIYRFHARCCENFRKGRVFLAGDAAHITPPFAGQGLVSGLRDAGNLCWKLAWVLRGHADPRILDSYNTERRPHADAMITLAQRLGRLIMPVNPVKAFLVHGAIRALRLIGPLRRHLDEFKLKPTLTYPNGLFVRGHARLLRGAWFPQSLVRTSDGDLVLSDEVLGDRVTLVGFGVDPRDFVDEQVLNEWQADGGNVLQIAARGQTTARTEDAVEDLTGDFVPMAAPFGWAAVVRPDRTILHDGPVADSARMIAESRDLLGVSSMAKDPATAKGAATVKGSVMAKQIAAVNGSTSATPGVAIADVSRRQTNG